MSRRLIIFGGAVTVVGLVIYFTWAQAEKGRSGSQMREVTKLPEQAWRPQGVGDINAEAATKDAGWVRADDALFKLPTDEESWRQAVENYSQADDDAYLERQHNRFAAAKHGQAIEAAPVSAEDRRRLKDLLMSKELAEIDLSIAAKKNGLPRRGPEFDAWVSVERERIDREIVALVGPTYFAEMQAMPGGRGIRLLGFYLMGEVYLRGAPLTTARLRK